MTGSRMWMLIAAFVVGLLITPVYLIASSGGGNDYGVTYDASPEFQASPVLQGRGPDVAPTAASSPQQAEASPTAARATASATPPASTATPSRVAPTTTPAAQQQALSGGADATQLNGRFRITDTVTEGQGAGLVVNFDVDLRQDGSAVSGGSGDITLTGVVEGRQVRMQFTQPRLGYTGTFLWSLDGTGRGSGTFSTSVPNSGTSVLTRA